MPYDALCRAVPEFPAALDDLTALHDDAAIWPLLRRLLEAPAPSGGANLPGGVGEVIGALASELVLARTDSELAKRATPRCARRTAPQR